MTSSDSVSIQPELLSEMLARSIAEFGDRTAVDFLDRTWTYRDIGALVDRAAAGFQALGVGPGVRVGLCLPNCHYYIVAFFAVAKCGGTVVNFNPLYVEKELDSQIRDSGTTIMVTMSVKAVYPKIAAVAQSSGLKTIVVCELQRALPFVKGLLFPIVKRKDLAPWPRDSRHVLFESLLKSAGSFRPVAIKPDDVAVLQYTGGTTGLPKGAMLTHGNLTANAAQSQIVADVPSSPQPIALGALPLFHVFAMTTVMLLCLRLGARIILLPRFDLAQVLEVIRTKRPTLFPGVPTIYVAINGRNLKPEDMNSLEFCVSGGAPLPLEVKLNFEALTGCKLVEGYGLTEASPVVAANPPHGLVKAGSIGLPLAGTEVMLRDPETGRIIEVAGERGELCIRGPQVMAGYWGRPEETAQVFVDGWLRTGDIGYRDEDGYFFLVDRIKDLILCGGYNVYPRVIEEALYQHPAVAEAIAIGIPDAYRGQAPKAFVKLKDGMRATPEDLIEHLRLHISKIEMPKAVEIRDELPKTMIGKLSKKELVAEELAKAS